jgi:hypothetical protein
VKLGVKDAELVFKRGANVFLGRQELFSGMAPQDTASLFKEAPMVVCAELGQGSQGLRKMRAALVFEILEVAAVLDFVLVDEDEVSGALLFSQIVWIGCDNSDKGVPDCPGFAFGLIFAENLFCHDAFAFGRDAVSIR